MLSTLNNYQFVSSIKAIEGMFLINSVRFTDDRGWLIESFNKKQFFEATGLNCEFAQENHSFSSKWVLRGLHYQLDRPQGKLLRVISGSIFDVAVDLRTESASYGKWFGMKIDAENYQQLWLPPGIAHGFLVLSENAELVYKMSDYYYPQDEVCLAWNDPGVGIEWPLPAGTLPNVSAKDAAGLSWDDVPKF